MMSRTAKVSSSIRQRIGIYLLLALSVLLLLMGAVPQQYIPERLTPFVSVKGRFEGKPVRLTAPKGREREATANIRIKMEQGMCRGSLRKETELKGLFNIGEGTCLAQIPKGSEIVLDPQGNPGDYEIAIGPEWHPLGPKARRFMLLPMGVSLGLASVFAGKLRVQVKRLGGKRLLFLAGIAAISGLFFYPICHEGGHLLLGMLFGAKPNWQGVVWTCLSGEEPHAAFSYLPAKAGPFMSAGGHLIPTLAALLLLLVWRLVPRNIPWYVSTALVWVPVLFLFSTLGCLFELYGNTHMDALSVHLGFTGPVRVAFSLSPLLVALAAYVWLALRFSDQKRAMSSKC